MKRLPVASDAMKEIGYDEELSHLEVMFHNGVVTRYKRVPRRVYTKLINAGSIGKFFHTSVRPIYEYEDVSAKPRSNQVEEETT